MNFIPYLNYIVSVRDRKDINLFYFGKFYCKFLQKKLSTIEDHFISSSKTMATLPHLPPFISS